MMTKLVRIGRDAEMKTTPAGTSLLEVSVVYDVGYGDNKKGQWVKLAMFGDRAQKLVNHFTKGKQIVVSMDDVKSDAWIKNGEAASSLSATIVDFSFVSDGNRQQQPQQAPQHQPQPMQQQAPQMAPPQPQYQPQQQMQQQQQQYQSAPQPQGYGGAQQTGK